MIMASSCLSIGNPHTEQVIICANTASSSSGNNALGLPNFFACFPFDILERVPADILYLMEVGLNEAPSEISFRAFSTSDSLYCL